MSAAAKTAAPGATAPDPTLDHVRPDQVPIAPARVIVADPPWAFDDKLPGESRGAAKNYKTLELRDIQRFPLPAIDDNAILFLWRVASMQEEALAVLRVWGFTLKSELVWRKRTKDGEGDAFGMGRYVRGAHETCLIATRGRFRVVDKAVRSIFETHVLEAPLGAHSAKPDAFFALVEKLAGTGPFVELFGRKPRPGWHVFGNELPSGYSFTEPSADSPQVQQASGEVQSAPGVDSVNTDKHHETKAIATANQAAPEQASPADKHSGAENHAETGDVDHPGITSSPGEEDPHQAMTIDWPTDEPTRRALVKAAAAEGIIAADLPELSFNAAWLDLKDKVSKRRTAGEWVEAALKRPRDVARVNGIRTIGDLGAALAAVGAPISIPDLAAWPAADREEADAWLSGGEVGSPPKRVEDQMRKACSACAAGKPVGAGAEHNQRGPFCLPGREKRAQAGGEPIEGPDPAPGEAEAKGKGNGKGRRAKAVGGPVAPPESTLPVDPWTAARARARDFEPVSEPRDFG